MKEFNQIVLRKGLFASVEGKLCLTKEHLANQEGQVEVEYPPPLTLPPHPLAHRYVLSPYAVSFLNKNRPWNYGELIKRW